MRHIQIIVQALVASFAPYEIPHHLISFGLFISWSEVLSFTLARVSFEICIVYMNRREMRQRMGANMYRDSSQGVRIIEDWSSYTALEYLRRHVITATWSVPWAMLCLMQVVIEP